ncbi:unnamed protein product [Miscanthus lutarioriparius]|uniref:ABC transporter domain-containing protein n=1 Tax=Miscanthus lutarioriparius TaxID=422564 RepID=A0A811S7J6_9POAL|nr:unnamed protein product [Miscanthus lutarioriparius]
MASSASGQQPPKTNQHVELIISSDDHDAGTAAGRLFDEEDEAKELLLDVVDCLADDDGVDDGPAAALPGTGGRPPSKIQVWGLRKRAASTGEEILRGVHLDVPHGVVMGVIGPSGSGKSTLLRALNRLWEPAPGAVFLDGADVCGLDVLRSGARSACFSSNPPCSTDEVHEHVDRTKAYNVRYGPQLRGKKLTEAEVQSLLRLADLDPALSSKPANELSVGQAQRVALARTLANDPEVRTHSLTHLHFVVVFHDAASPVTTPYDHLMQVLLLDEPTSALDPISTQNIEDTIVRLKNTRGITTVIVSHSVKQIQRIADLVCPRRR